MLADDHTIMLEGLKSLLAPDFDVVGAVQDGRSLLAEAERLKPDVLVVDISMPLLNGVEATRELRAAHPSMKIVVLTGHRDASLLKKALHAGALGYVLKQSAVGEFGAAIRAALAGRRFVSSDIVETLGVPLKVFLRRRRRAPDDLTQRQREVLQLVAEGKSLKEIAAILGITAKTAEFHKYRIMRSLGVGTTAELTQHAVMMGLLDLEA